MQKPDQQQLLPCVEVEPAKKPTHSVIWLHGLGADGNDFAPVVPELQLPPKNSVRFIFPHAPVIPVTINHGYHMRAWFDILSLDIDKRIDEKGLQNSKVAIEALIQHEEDRGIPHKNIFVGGFSQGAVMAFLVGLSQKENLAGIIALSGFMANGQQSIAQAAPTLKNMPILIAHGTHDPVVPAFLSQSAFELLHANGFNVVFKTYETAHNVTGKELHDLSQWLQQHMR